jgi:deoxyribonuclease-4
MLGVHISGDYKLLLSEVDRVKNIGCSFIQLFVDITQPENIYKAFSKKIKKENIKCIVHGSYTINLAQDWDEYSLHIRQFIQEIKFANLCGAIGIIIHMGKYLDKPIEHAINNMYSSLLYVNNQTKKYNNIKILLETPASQGTELFYKLEDLANFYNKFRNHRNIDIKERIKICIDTCHIFASGYDIRTKEKIDKYLKELDDKIEIKNILLIHLNDSKTELGSRVDRHANIGKGYIGEEGLKYFAKYFINKKINIVLETPFDLQIDDLTILKK